MKPYLGGVLVLTRISYVALGASEFLEPWEKPKMAGIGSKIVPGSRPRKSDRTKASKSGKKGAKGKKGDTHKAQSQKSPPHPKDELDSQELRDAIELSKSDGVGTSKSGRSKVTNPEHEETEDEKALTEAIRQSLADMSDKATTLPSVFTCLEEENYILTQDEAEKIRETLIALSQDTRAVISLLLTQLRESHDTIHAELTNQIEEEERLQIWDRMQNEQEALFSS